MISAELVKSRAEATYFKEAASSFGQSVIDCEARPVKPLRYGLNPHQRDARYEAVDSGGLPFEVVSGELSYINLLDALNAWQLVHEAALVTGRITAASFKHVSPAGVAFDGDAPEFLMRIYNLTQDDLSPTAAAYLRARSSDARASYGDFIAVSHTVDLSAARLISRVASDGIIAPEFDPDALAVLQQKRRGRYLMLRADPTYTAPATESREVFGVRLTQQRDTELLRIETALATGATATLSDEVAHDLLLGLVTVKHTQSNSVAFIRRGHVIGIGAGQQSRIDCTRLAGTKALRWHILCHPKLAKASTVDGSAQQRINTLYDLAEATSSDQASAPNAPAMSEALSRQERLEWAAMLTGVSYASDGYLPFEDNIVEAHRYGVETIAAPAGSIRDASIAQACRERGITLIHTPHRYFHH